VGSKEFRVAGSLTGRRAAGPIAGMDKTSPRSVPPRRLDVRREREAEALRANLRKRKEQQRAREVPEQDEPEPGPKSPPDSET
jgi:hypothetical protein